MVKRVWKKVATDAFSAEQAVVWASTFNHACVLLSNNYKEDKYSRFNMIVAAGSHKLLSIPSAGNTVEQLSRFHETNKDWMFGYLSYDLKNEIEELYSENADYLQFPILEFFIPRIIFLQNEEGMQAGVFEGSIEKEDLQSIIAGIAALPVNIKSESRLKLHQRMDKSEYLKQIKLLKENIQYGNIYEVNFCHEFYCENAHTDASSLFLKLNRYNPSPFAAFMRSGQRYAMCSSPERWLCRQQNTLISQPIKGTAGRSKDSAEDKVIALSLRDNPKEQAENVMIVDLVRNDLSRVAEDCSVKVDELFGIYTFPKVHQMISTVTCRIPQEISLAEIIRATFPMGSMTGAPKIKAMQLIEETETVKRGLYSGSIGYLNPEGDFDFNVVIRSILYNAGNAYISVMAGGAITAASDEELEYQESLLKMQAMKKVIEE